MNNFDEYSKVSGILGPAISCGFLFLVGIINCVSIFMILKTIRQAQSRTASEDVDWDQLHESGGFFSRVFGKWLFRVIDAPWKMYPVGFLFGLGFDTSTEISLLAIAALQSASGSSTWLILCLPLLFTCGMALVDTLDGMLMLGVYGWATVAPLTKLYYNLVITTVSSFFAVFVALVELLGIFQEVYGLGGPFWEGVGSVSDSFGFVGAAALASFVAGWLVSRFAFRAAVGDAGEDRRRSPGALLREEEELEEQDGDDGEPAAAPHADPPPHAVSAAASVALRADGAPADGGGGPVAAAPAPPARAAAALTAHV